MVDVLKKKAKGILSQSNCIAENGSDVRPRLPDLQYAALTSLVLALSLDVANLRFVYKAEMGKAGLNNP